MFSRSLLPDITWAEFIHKHNLMWQGGRLVEIPDNQGLKCTGKLRAQMLILSDFRKKEELKYYLAKSDAKGKGVTLSLFFYSYQQDIFLNIFIILCCIFPKCFWK